jgi:hypothetical protein
MKDCEKCKANQRADKWIKLAFLEFFCGGIISLDGVLYESIPTTIFGAWMGTIAIILGLALSVLSNREVNK